MDSSRVLVLDAGQVLISRISISAGKLSDKIFQRTIRYVNTKNPSMPCRRGLVVASLPATEETVDMGREIEFRRGIHRVVALKIKNKYLCKNNAGSQLHGPKQLQKATFKTRG
jgi:hypothetical protein